MTKRKRLNLFVERYPAVSVWFYFQCESQVLRQGSLAGYGPQAGAVTLRLVLNEPPV
jgi:hypothetical protein